MEFIRMTLRSKLGWLGLLFVLAACGGEKPPEHTEPETGDGGASCEPGVLGCACASGDVCGVDARGESLLCRDHLCVPANCTTGESGCLCTPQGTCSAQGDTCRSGVCKNESCTAGERGCDCLVGACNAGLLCDNALGGGTCVDATGLLGGACPENGLCKDQTRCDRDTNTCVHCELGSQGCLPAQSGCNTGLVLAGQRCLSPMDVPPDNPKCYTRCRADLITDKSVRLCSPDGFIEGCLDGLECVSGSCVAKGETPIACEEGGDCPDFQACIAGGCYANCDRDADCSTGRSCYRHVCRVPCERPGNTSDACPEGEYCMTQNGETGVCMPLGSASDESADSSVRASFEVTPTTLTLDSLRSTGSVVLSTDSPLAETFEVVKLSQRAYGNDGRVVDERDVAKGEAPLPFLALSAGGKALEGSPMYLTVPARCGEACPTLTVRVAEKVPAAWTRWEGVIELRHPELGVRQIKLAYAVTVDGRWAGTMYYFGSFPDQGLPAWRASSDKSNAQTVGNGLIRRWAAYRRGNLDGAFAELNAVLTATHSESFRWPSVKKACKELLGQGDPSGLAACYLFDDGHGAAGIRTYVANQNDAPIPTGVTEYPIALNLRSDALDGRILRGRIDSSVALHYAGDPSVRLTLSSSPTAPGVCERDGVPKDCVSFVSELSADILLGGREQVSASEDCKPGFTRETFPWLVPGFVGNASYDSSSGSYSQSECRDTRAPLPGKSALNASLTVGNPVPDGLSRKRELRLVDGAMINQRWLFVMFEERFQPFAGRAAFSAYGYMLLERNPEPVEDADLTSQPAIKLPDDGVAQAGPSCDPALLQEAFGKPTNITRANAAEVVSTLLSGVRATGAEPYPQNLVHYLCEDTGLFDGGPDDHGHSSDVRVDCPVESNVHFFVFPTGAVTQDQIAALDCQQHGTCGDVLARWVDSSVDIDLSPVWACSDKNAVFCSTNRHDLRADKVFYRPGESAFMPLATAVQEAFRYKIRFQSDSGRTLGFTPRLCFGSGDLTPYCYDASQIEALEKRSDCLLWIYQTYATHDLEWSELRTYLSGALSYVSKPAPNLPAPLLQDGFERLNAELLIMLGDESYTSALRSRFDLAATQGATFFGEQFEEGGIYLTGTAGYEMHSLYQATQYYDLATERFYRVIAPVIYSALDKEDVGEVGSSLVSPGLVSWYLERLIGGSAKRASVWSEIARRYQSFDRSDLARRVVERAYTSAYLESVILSRLMLDIAKASGGQREQVVSAIEQAQSRYRVALSEMRDVYASISDDVNAFGFTADYVPFPAIDDADTRFNNAFEVLLGTARRRADTARRDEDLALASNRQFETDAESFQAELVNIARSHEQRLQDICGAFEGRDGRVYPAIDKYAEKSDRTSLLGDPCGLVGNGDIHQALGQLQLLQGEQNILETRMANVQADVEGEEARVDQRCGLIDGVASFKYRQGNQVKTLEEVIRGMRTTVSGFDRSMQVLSTVAGLQQCETGPGGDSCASSAISLGTFLSAAVPLESGSLYFESLIAATETEIDQTNLDTARWETERECDALQIESNALVAKMLREAQVIKLESLQLQGRFELLRSDVEHLYLEAQRLQEAERESEQLAINVEAARNDPNIRVYRNAAIMTADRSFQIAMQHAYRATAMYEYFTSQSYDMRAALFVTRMVGQGYDNLDHYLDALEDAYEAFRSDYGVRARDVDRISLRDDIFRIPYRDGDRELDENARIARFKDLIESPRLLDAEGRLTITFRTNLEDLNACTFSHKIEDIQIQLIGGELGDDEADIELWQDGTAVVKTAAQSLAYYRLPAALSIVNPSINRRQPFDPAVYRRYEFRDRPYVNTSWKLVLDQRNNRANQDIPLENLDDIVLYVNHTYLTDRKSCR
jgi:hypothetical protein